MLLHTSTGMMGTGNMFQVLLLHGPILSCIWTGPIIPIHIILALREKNRSTRTRVNSNILIADAIIVLKEDMK